MAFAATVDAPPDITYTNGSCGYVFVTSHGHQVATLASELAFSHAYRHVLGLAG